MKLSEVRQEYYDSSGTVSTLVRSICYAGIAVGWAIRINEKPPVNYSSGIGLAFLFFLLALSSDLLQYLVKAATWGIYNELKHKSKVLLDDEVAPPAWFNHLPLALWILKIALAITGVAVLGSCLWSCIIYPPK